MTASAASYPPAAPGHPYPQPQYAYHYPYPPPAPGYHWPAAPPSSSYLATEIIIPRDHDILLGRGGKNNGFAGNEQLRIMARAMRDRYMVSSKKEKSAIARDLVKQVQDLSPPGRFLKRENVTAAWEEVDLASGKEKASQCLRDAVTTFKAGDLKLTSPSAKGNPTKVVQQKRKERKPARKPAPISPHASRSHTPQLLMEGPEMPPLQMPTTFKRQRIGTWEVDPSSSLKSDQDHAGISCVHTIPMDEINNLLPAFTRPDEWDLLNFDGIDEDLLEPAGMDLDDSGADNDPFGTDFF